MSDTATTTAAVQAGTLADVPAIERLVQPISPPGVSEGASHGLARLVLAHLALTTGGLWVVRDADGRLRSAAALLPPGTHPDVAGLSWLAQVQLGVNLSGMPATEAPHLLLPPREGALAAELVRVVLRFAPRHVLCPRPVDPEVAAVVCDHGFVPDVRPGLLRRAA